MNIHTKITNTTEQRIDIKTTNKIKTMPVALITTTPQHHNTTNTP